MGRWVGPNVIIRAHKMEEGGSRIKGDRTTEIAARVTQSQTTASRQRPEARQGKEHVPS